MACINFSKQFRKEESKWFSNILDASLSQLSLYRNLKITAFDNLQFAPFYLKLRYRDIYVHVCNDFAIIFEATLCCGRQKKFPEVGAETVSTLIRLRCAARIYLRIVTAARG